MKATEERSMPCVFCDIARGQGRADVVHRDDLVTAFRDIRPRAPMHVLVIPNQHIASADQLATGDGPVLARMFEVAREVAEREGVAEDGYRLVINVGRAAGQSVGHLHMHVLGGRHLGWPPG